MTRFNCLRSCCMGVGLAFAAAVLLSACAGTPSGSPGGGALTRPVMPAIGGTADFALVPGDEIEIRFFERSDLNVTTRVRPDGFVDLQLAGPVRAYGLSPEALSAAIAAAYRALAPDAASAADFKYLFAVGDELEIRLPYHSGMDQIVKVRPDGRISLPLIGTLHVLGMAPEALETELDRRYAQHVRKPAVSVNVRSFSSMRIQAAGRWMLAAVTDAKPTVFVRNLVPRQVFIGGEVARPGVLNHRHALTALQAIIEAGGLKTTSAGANVAILRRTSDGPKLIPLDATTLDAATMTSPNDIDLEPFDIVLVPKTALAAAADAVNQVFNLVPPLRNSTFGLIYEIDKK